MQDKYVGDIGDFGKFALLLNIIGNNFKLGINWYHVPDDEHVGGNITKWLSEERFDGYDDKLKSELKNLVKEQKRKVRELEKADILNNETIYYNYILDFYINKNNIPAKLIRDYRKNKRNEWHQKALYDLKDCDIVFLDPDNGININDLAIYAIKGNKYISQNELIDYYNNGKSIIFYSHRPMQKKEIYIQKFINLQRLLDFDKSKWLGITFHRYAAKDFIFIIQPEHYEQLSAKINDFLHSKWEKHFSSLFNF